MKKSIIALPNQPLSNNLAQLSEYFQQESDAEKWVSVHSSYLMDYMDIIAELKKLNYKVLLVLEDEISEGARAQVLRLAVWSNVDGISVNENANNQAISEIRDITAQAIKERKKDIIEAKKCGELLQKHLISNARYMELKGMNKVMNSPIMFFIQLYQASPFEVKSIVDFIQKHSYQGVIADESTAKILRGLTDIEVIVVSGQQDVSKLPNGYDGTYYPDIVKSTRIDEQFHI